METNWRDGFVPAPDARYVQVDIEPTEIGRSIPARIGVVGDIRTVLRQLLAAVEERGAGLPPGAFVEHPRTVAAAAELEAIEAEIATLARSEQRPIHPLRVIRAVRDTFPRDTTVAIDVGCITQHMAAGTPFFRVFEPRSLIVPSSFYGMGFAAGALPAARLVHPERHAVGLVGDGSFQMIANVLSVAVDNRLPVTWCIFDDDALGSIRDIQQYRFDERIVATDFTVQPDFARLAEAYGCRGERVDDPGAVDAALARARDANDEGTPAVIDFAVARERLLGTLEYATFFPEELHDRLRPAPLPSGS
jgi:acetolactate synthase-1/2/3 large subunit